VDKNYFEIAYALNRQFSPDGLYTGLPLYNFVDNHDVDRVASRLEDPAHLYPLYLLLFSMPGVPSIYYGSEFGLEGRRTPYDDHALRPAFDLLALQRNSPHPRLVDDIARLASVRQALPALRYGAYTQLHVAAQQFAFARQSGSDCVVVLLNASAGPVPMEVTAPAHFTRALDCLNHAESFPIRAGKLRVDTVYPYWGRILRLEK